MQPYTLEHIFKEFSSVTKYIVLYLPRTSDLRQIADCVEEGKKGLVVHYCTRAYSRALCAYLGDFQKLPSPPWKGYWCRGGLSGMARSSQMSYEYLTTLFGFNMVVGVVDKMWCLSVCMYNSVAQSALLRAKQVCNKKIWWNFLLRISMYYDSRTIHTNYSIIMASGIILHPALIVLHIIISFWVVPLFITPSSYHILNANSDIEKDKWFY